MKISGSASGASSVFGNKKPETQPLNFGASAPV